MQMKKWTNEVLSSTFAFSIKLQQSIDHREACVYPRLFIGSIVQLNLPQNGGKSQSLKGEHRFNGPDILHHHIGVWAGVLAFYHPSYHGCVPYQLQLWAFTTSIICNAKTALSAPARSQPVGSPFCLTLCVWLRSPRSTRPHPRGTAVVMVTMPITVTEREAVSGGRAGGCHRHRWLFQSSA